MKKSAVYQGLVVLGIVFLNGCASRCVVKQGEKADFFPQTATYKPETDSYVVRTAGRIYEPGSPRLLRGAILGMRVANLAGMGLNTQLLQERVSSIIAENQAKRRVQLEFANSKKPVSANRTDAQGWFQQEFEIPASALGQPDSDGFAHYQVPSCEGDARPGTVQLLKPGGLSIISTIEDTIQASELNNPLAVGNLLFREYKPVEGMSARFQRWKDDGAAFHYVSSIPRELYASVARFIKQEGFPAGSIDLQAWVVAGGSAMDKLEQLVSAAEDTAHKTEAMARLIERSPGRQFILVGNSSMKDPEVFGQVARRFPQQVSAIYIREARVVSDSDRYEEAFRNLPKDKWTVFKKPQSLPATLPTRT